MSARAGTEIETYCGAYLDYLDPRAEDIELADIARGLSQTCRFAGQTSRYYTVAEHAVYVKNLTIQGGRPDLALAALHHDSHEAFLGDWTSPLKNAIGKEVFEAISDAIDVAIAERFAFPVEQFKADAVAQADELALRRESATLKYSHGVGPHWGNDVRYLPLVGVGWMPDRAEREFLAAHEECTYLAAG